MKSLLTLVGLFALTASSAIACTPEKATAEGADLRSTQSALGTTVWTVPDANSTTTTGVALDKGLVVTAMQKLQAAFYDKTNRSAYDPAHPPPATGFNDDEARQCAQACPPYYSDVVCHFYCWHPSYSTVNPNVRACFTEIARNAFTAQIGQSLLYPQAYDYCTYQPFNYVTAAATIPRYDRSVIDQNMAAGTKPGVNKWVDDNERDAFKHVMFTWYDPAIYTIDSQEAALNEFYGVHLSKPDYDATDTADVAACQAARRRTSNDTASGVPNGMECSTKKSTHSNVRHPQWAQIVGFMKGTDPSLH